MTAPTFDQIFAVMAAASVGDDRARVELPAELSVEDERTRIAIALNLLLDDLALHRAELSAQHQERLRAEAQLRQAQKMEAIGQLAGGVAHDFNNVLTVILSLSTMGIARLPEGPQREELEEIRAAGERAANLTRQLLAFSRRQILTPQVLDLDVVVRGIVPMLQRLIPEHIELVAVSQRELGRVLVDRGQLEQVLVNLVVNARDAMPQGGKLTIETASVVLDESYARTHAEVVPGPHVLLAVSDTGVGMEASVRDRIFEPFFTTKDKGTGLGLATVLGIVKQSRGHIWVYSEPGAGTTIKVYFPLTSAAARAVSPAPTPSRGGTETILLAEDEAQVRAVMAQILRLAGYQVLIATSGENALALSDVYDGVIDLLLTDVVMAGMSGRALAQRLQPLRPGLKVLYVSGYADNSIVHHGILDEGIAFLQKPVMPDALCRKVRAVLDARVEATVD